MPLVERQEHELWLTAAQSLFAIILIADFSMNRWEAVTLFALFAAQLVMPLQIGNIDVRMAFTILYLVLSALLLLDPNRREGIRLWPRYIRESLQKPPPPEVLPPVPSVAPSPRAPSASSVSADDIRRDVERQAR
jgi:cation:H+ antiporter